MQISVEIWRLPLRLLHDFEGVWMQISIDIWRFPLSFLILKVFGCDFLNIFNP